MSDQHRTGPATPPGVIEAARAQYARPNEVVIIADAEVIPNDDGAWVQAWVFVHKDGR